MGALMKWIWFLQIWVIISVVMLLLLWIHVSIKPTFWVSSVEMSQDNIAPARNTTLEDDIAEEEGIVSEDKLVSEDQDKNATKETKTDIFISGRLSVVPNSKWENRAVFFHSPGGSGEENSKIFQQLATLKINSIKPNTFRASDITFVTYNNKATLLLFSKFCMAYNFQHYASVARNYKVWDWHGKIWPLMKYLENDCRTEYVIAADGRDVAILLDRLHDYYDGYLIDVLKSYNCSMLFCNSVDDWPPNELYRKFENNAYNSSSKGHTHLSAGGFIGKRMYIIERLREISHAYLHKEPWAFVGGLASKDFDDALAWRALHYKYYPEIKVDSKCALWSRYDDFLFVP